MHGTEPTGLENLAGVIVFIIVIISILGLGGLAAMMAIGAIANRRQLITSWPMEQEHAFGPFEQQAQSSAGKAWVISLLVAAAAAVVVVGIYFGVPPDMRDITKDMNMSNLSKKAVKAEAPAPAPTPAPAAAPAAAPATDQKPADPAAAPADKK